MAVTIKLRKDSAGQSYGRGPDNHKIPGKYDVFVNNQQVGVILGRPVRFMGKGEWELFSIDKVGALRQVGRRSYWPKLAEAKAEAIRVFGAVAD